MKVNRRYAISLTMLLSLMAGLTSLSTRLRADTQTTGQCGLSITIPFTDVPSNNIFFCSIAAAYFSGLTNGTSPTTYNPSDPVPREQMAAFITRTLDQSLRRGSKRAALGQWWTLRPVVDSKIDVGDAPQFLASDGEYVYVSNHNSSTFSKVRASTGEVIDTYSFPSFINPQGMLVAGGNLWIGGSDRIWRIRLDFPNVFSSTVQNDYFCQSLTCDGINIWTANFGAGPNGSISRIAMDGFVSTGKFTTGFNRPVGIVFDGTWLWVTDYGDNTLKGVDPSSGAVVGSPIPVGTNPGMPTFDGTNIWVPALTAPQVVVVRAVGPFLGTVLASYSVQFGFFSSAFDGERILMTNYTFDRVALWKASDLTPIGNFAMPAGSSPIGVCSDGVKFWVALQNTDQIIRF
jgi:S-layer family protein